MIIKNGYCDTQIMDYLDEESKVVSSFDMNFDYYIKNNNLYSMIIILGGPQSAKDMKQHENLIKLDEFIVFCIGNNKPILGICLGCQIIAKIFGCEIKTLDSLNVGYDTKILNFNNIFRCHYECIVPNNMIEIIDDFNSMPYIFKIKGKNIYGIQCHPDIPPNLINHFCNDSKTLLYASQNSTIINNNNSNLIKYLLNKLRIN